MLQLSNKKRKKCFNIFLFFYKIIQYRAVLRKEICVIAHNSRRERLCFKTSSKTSLARKRKLKEKFIKDLFWWLRNCKNMMWPIVKLPVPWNWKIKINYSDCLLMHSRIVKSTVKSHLYQFLKSKLLRPIDPLNGFHFNKGQIDNNGIWRLRMCFNRFALACNNLRSK